MDAGNREGRMKKNNDEIEIDLLKLIKVLWSKALIIILVALLVASAAFAYTYLFVPAKYEATASIYVNNSSFSFGSTSFSITSSELNASNSLVNTYIYILNSRTTLEDVISRAGLSYSYEQLKGMLNPKAVTGTAAFDVTVRSSSPIEAELIATPSRRSFRTVSQRSWTAALSESWTMPSSQLTAPPRVMPRIPPSDF